MWLVFHHKKSGRAGLGQRDAVEEALCFGWIDSRVEGIDAETYRQHFTPRGRRSSWSALNKRRVARLVKEGRMTPAGQDAIDVAKENGSWSRLDVFESTQDLPAELEAALVKSARARAAFDAVSPSQRKLFTWMVASAKKPETRTRRAAVATRMLEAGERIDIKTRIGG